MSNTPIFDQLAREHNYSRMVDRTPESRVDAFFAVRIEPVVNPATGLAYDPHLDGPARPRDTITASAFGRERLEFFAEAASGEGITEAPRDFVSVMDESMEEARQSIHREYPGKALMGPVTPVQPVVAQEPSQGPEAVTEPLRALEEVLVQENVNPMEMEKLGMGVAEFKDLLESKALDAYPHYVPTTFESRAELNGTMTVTVKGVRRAAEEPQAGYKPLFESVLEE